MDSGGETKVAVAVAVATEEEESVVKLKSERRRSAHRLAEQTVVTGEEARLRRSLVAGGSRQI